MTSKLYIHLYPYDREICIVTSECKFDHHREHDAPSTAFEFTLRRDSLEAVFGAEGRRMEKDMQQNPHDWEEPVEIKLAASVVAWNREEQEAA